MRMGLLGALLSAVIAGPALAGKVTIDTATGPATVTANPTRVAVFDIAALDTLTALGVTVAGVPSPVYVDSLQNVAEAAQVVGTLFEPDFEALAVLQPDLIVIGGRSSAQAKALADIAPVIDMTISGGDTVAQAHARIAAFGAIHGKRAEAEALSAELDARLASVRSAVSGKGNALVLLTNGGKISAFGAGSRFGWLHSALGLPEAVPGLDSETHGQSVSFEFVADADPDWLLVVDRGAAVGAGGGAAAATLDNRLIARTKAARNGRIVFLDATTLYIAGGGANAMMRTLGEIASAFGDPDS
ncbi:siderophore ABC transporter substrate-binding protein [Sedimentitalea sp. JM2-8]|uniref:Siderophore ABC transporter substrate-binding protein n=1 Tax=Sedimentitalea xiamensis TaxID=3050037 RepID=A0ABT7FKA8_9RHOB|nr:siderophore ABC transporter substrate-binding protein [Sedimentitalea xiamensis]MDK3075348.1 siderophore ABC transporter substrate-binding protein [Sedimentitalea xiamensis]